MRGRPSIHSSTRTRSPAREAHSAVRSRGTSIPASRQSARSSPSVRRRAPAREEVAPRTMRDMTPRQRLWTREPFSP